MRQQLGLLRKLDYQSLSPWFLAILVKRTKPSIKPSTSSKEPSQTTSTSFWQHPSPSTQLRDAVGELGWKMSQDWNSYEMQTASFENQGIPFDQINKMREVFYNQLYSPAYILRQSVKGTIYSKIMVENAMHQLLWRMKLTWLSSNFKRIVRL